MKNPHDEDRAIRKLASSPYLLAVADSILAKIDPEALADLLATYLYLSSKGRGGAGNLVAYAVSRRFRETTSIVTGVAPIVFAGILADEDFRSAVLSFLTSSIRHKPAPGPAAKVMRRLEQTAVP